MGRKANRVSIKYPVLILVILAFVAGSAAGAFAELRIDSESRDGGLLYIDNAQAGGENNLSRASVFKQSIKNNGLLLIIMAAGGLTAALFPAILLAIVYKGAALGFTSALILDGNSRAGILEVCRLLLLHNLVFIPLFAVYGYICLSMAFDTLERRKKKMRRKYSDDLSGFVYATAAAAVVLCIGAATEAFINPVIGGLI